MSSDHAELGTRELILEQPVAEVDGQIYLVGLTDLHQMPVLIHVDRHKVVADFGSVLSRVCKAEFVILRSLRELRLLLQQNLIALDALLPSNLV